MKKFPSSKDILKEAIKEKPDANVNELHSLTYRLMKKHKEKYYLSKVKAFLSRPAIARLPKKTRAKIKKELLKPMKAKGVEYSNFMEEASRRISQTFQAISGNIAELCVETELRKVKLENGVHYRKRKERTDLIIYHPEFSKFSRKHRIEIKNVKLRERAARGLAFDGDSLVGFFNDPSEFTDTHVAILHTQCEKTGGYCYIPPATLKSIKKKIKGKRFKSNQEFASDMKRFVKKGVI